MELAVQLGIIMIGKQALTNIQEIMWPYGNEICHLFFSFNGELLLGRFLLCINVGKFRSSKRNRPPDGRMILNEVTLLVCMKSIWKWVRSFCMRRFSAFRKYRFSFTIWFHHDFCGGFSDRTALCSVE